MNLRRSPRRTRAFTLVEMLVVIGVIGILAAFLLPGLSAGKKRATRIVCESRLRQIGIGFQSFAHDHNSKFPMQVSTNDGGSFQFIPSGFVARHFQTLASTLQTPAILVCPADTRLPATNFDTLQNSNISYFVGVSADYGQPMSILSGDGNLATSASTIHGVAGGQLTWTRQQHEYKGNVLFADGHVEEWKDLGGNRLGSRSDLALPSLRSNDGQTSQPGQPGGAFPSANDANPVAATNATTAPSTNPPPPPPLSSGPAFAAAPGRHNSGATVVIRSTDKTPTPTVTNSPPGTNAPGGGAVNPGADDSTMSPFDRQLAKFLRDIILGTYLFILLLLLLFIAYRLWRYYSDPERQRRQAARRRS